MASCRQYVIWDIDNCLADDRHRMHLIDWSKEGDERYAAYNQQMRLDPVVHGRVFQVLSQIATPVFFTGRPAKFEEVTRDWLRLRLGDEGSYMFMRQNGTFGVSPVQLKEQMLNNFKRYFGIQEPHIVGAFDDIPAVVQMYQRYGIPAAILRAHDQLEKVYAASDLR